MALDKIVIVGTGQGGFQAAASLRQEGYEGEITMIGDEAGLPYQRPPLSKAYMKEANIERIQLRPENFYTQNRINLVDATRVEQIDRAERAVVTSAGDRIAYDHLILATGARNAVTPIKGIHEERVFGLRSMMDADHLRSTLEDAKHVIIIGGGFIGLEFAAVAREMGREVVVLEAASRLMERAVSPEMSSHFERIHCDRGTMLKFGQPVVEVSDEGAYRPCRARLANGDSFDGDFILLAAGVRPNQELAAATGLSTANGIIVNQLLLTSDANISALGDCAAFPDPRTGELIRLESVQAASDHARTIARRLTGKPAAYTALPWFWSDQFDAKLQIAGLPSGADKSFVRKGNGDEYCVYRFAENKLVCVETVNSAREHMTARKLLATGSEPVFWDDLKQVGFELAALMKRQKEMAST
ncbi:pyridine nucleotide-disulfide oxidoreductase [Thalassospira profundimaris]|uniref:Pyridine nucleotide-disulfide oxidoreductase n=1 Tax=Thalassospira profundimaris TaxID=502049 RepID=A0A367WHR9_9PROT|nr:FAD-dependent oxidoreductase [Thalassospira profundimaris]RCK40995.1 pyridine nucleotide-disulfide oxidoreductase [Thalassospira profundimaris]